MDDELYLFIIVINVFGINNFSIIIVINVFGINDFSSCYTLINKLGSWLEW
jgi:hypothetical protein